MGKNVYIPCSFPSGNFCLRLNLLVGVSDVFDDDTGIDETTEVDVISDGEFEETDWSGIESPTDKIGRDSEIVFEIRESDNEVMETVGERRKAGVQEEETEP